MIKSNLKGNNLITTRDWQKQDLVQILELAEEMQEKRFAPEFNSILQNKSFLMLFYSPSTMARQSFEIGATELGAHALSLDPAPADIEDGAKVMDRYGCGLGIRILEDKIEAYGDGEKLLREYARYCRIPVISMGHDKYHPCQGLAELMACRRHLEKEPKGKTALYTWAPGGGARSRCSVQESMLLSSRMDMNVTVAHPQGYSLDKEIVQAAKKNCSESGLEFSTTNDPVEAYRGADVVYSKNWMSEEAYAGGGVNKVNKQKETEKALKFSNWICNEEKMKLTDNALFSRDMYLDRDHESPGANVSPERSVTYDIAENRLHVQKAVMALTMGG